MRNLTSTLLAAQKSQARLPYLKVEIRDKVGGITRPAWSRLYTGSEPDYHHAAAMPGDGSLTRARVDPASYELYLQRVTSPGPGSNFGTWSFITTVSSASGIALCSEGATVLLFYAGTDQQTIYVKESADYGASYGSPVAIVTAPSAVGWLAADLNDQGVVALFYSVGGTVCAVKRSGGSWGSPSAWTNSLSSVSGIGCVYLGDWNVAIAGQDSSSNYLVATCVYGDGYSRDPGVWSSLAELALASTGSNVELRCPSLGFSDVLRLFLVEKYTGTGSYSRPVWSYSMASADFIANRWREPVPFDLSCTYGMALATSSSYLWSSTPSGVWRAPLSPPPVEVTSDLVRLEVTTGPTSARLRLELRNDDGRYGAIGSGAYAAIKEGAEVRVSPGYRTSAGNEVSAGPAYWVEGWDYLSEGGKATFVLHAHDGWGLLESWKARRQFAWAAGARNIFNLLGWVLARAGLDCTSLSASSTVVNQYPAFTIHPGKGGAEVVRRLLAMIPDVLFFCGGCAYLKNPQATDPADYSYGTGHPIQEGRYALASPSVNRVQVYGDGVLAESFAWAEVAKVYDRLRQVHDLNLDTLAKAQARADAELRDQSLAALGGEITVPTNCAQELYDVITITDSRAGLTAAKRRVLGLTLRYHPLGPESRYDQRLILGGV